MILNTNMEALSAYKSLNKNSAIGSMHSKRLATGKRINSASDDAASLSISTKMKAQLRGIGRAVNNVDDAQSLVNVADGALSEASALVNRIRELCVQAANDTNTYDDRIKMQNEIAQLTSEINKISTHTHFNNINLLDGSIEGTYEYAYGLKQPTMHGTSAEIRATDVFQPAEIMNGTNAELTLSTTNLNILNGPPPNFPLTGVFAIEVRDPTRGNFIAVLDFEKENPAGNFTLSDFTSFFKTMFEKTISDGGLLADVSPGEPYPDPVADFSVDATGAITVNATGIGGTNSYVLVGLNNLTSINAAISNANTSTNITVPLSTTTGDTAFVNSSIFGTTASASSSTSSGIVTTRAFTDTELAPYLSGSMFDATSFLNAHWNTLTSTNVSFGHRLRVSPYTSYTDATFSTSSASSLNHFNSILGANISGYSVSASGFVDRDGYVYISFSGYTSNPQYSTVTYMPTFSHPTSSDYNSHIAPTYYTSDYDAKVSEEIGVLTISITGIPNGASTKTATCTIDFSSSAFKTFIGGYADPVQGMLAYINNSLNAVANVPNPPARFPASAVTASNKVATASLDSSGRLVITAAEYGFGISISETLSDEPMYYRSSSATAGTNFNNVMTIFDDFGNASPPISIQGGEFDDIDQFIAANSASFRNSGYFLENNSGKLIIKSIGEGKEYTVDRFTFTGVNTTVAIDHRTYILQKLGIENAVFIDGTTDPATIDQTKALWIQNGANSGDHVYIAVPCLDAYDLGLMLKDIDFLQPNLYVGISKYLGVENYTNTANVEPALAFDPMGYGLDVTNNEKATHAITIANNALNILAEERSQLGAMKNRLEHTNAAHGVTLINLSDANSRLEDADMAKEFMEYTRCNFLRQAGINMLSQSNSKLYDVMRLIQQ